MAQHRLQDEDETLQNLAENRSEESVEEMSDSRRTTQKLKAAIDHSSSMLHSELVKDQSYRRCIALKQRVGNWFYNTFRCSSADASYVEKLDEIESNYPVQLSEGYRNLFKNKIIKLKIIQTSRLKLDSNVIHPFVKIHIVDKNTGCYLKKNVEGEQPVIYHHEALTFYDQRERKYDACANNMILPFATAMCDFRELGNSIGFWNQKFYINYPAEKLMSPDTLLLFELLDFNHQALTYKDTETYDRDYFHRIAWGYLRPVGVCKTHIGITKIQLYSYKFNNLKAEGELHKSFVPSVYYDFLWSNHEKYEGFLTVQLVHVSKPKYRLMEEESDYPQHLFEEYRADPTFIDRHHRNVSKVEDQEVNSDSDLLRFYRNNGICEVPKELIYKLESDKLGCYRTLFVGDYLFAACSTRKYTSIKVYSLGRGEHVMTIKGHREIIYSLQVTENEKYLISAGSDRFAKIWEIPARLGEFIDEGESQRYLRGECLHTAAIYCTSAIHVPIADKLYLLTCCYDGYIRLWQVNLTTKDSNLINQMLINTYERSPAKVYPTACAVSESNYFIVGDSIGDIRVYDFSRQNLNLRCLITSQELKKDQILNIKILNKNNLIIQASDNLIRHFELSANRLRLAQKFIGAQFEKHLSDCTVSPDNKYVLCPSEAGRPYLWDMFTGAQISLDHLNLGIKGPLITCSWHPRYNLVAFGGFIELCPIMVYGNILTDAEQKLVAAQALT